MKFELRALTDWFYPRDEKSGGSHAKRAARMESLEARVLLAVDAALLAAEGFQPLAWKGEQVYARPGHWIAGFNGINGRAVEQLDRVNALLAKVRPDVRAIRHLGLDGLVLMETPAKLTHAQLRASIAPVAPLRFIEPDFAVWINNDRVVPNDPMYSSLWGMEKIMAPEAWAISTGSPDVIVAVIDSGVDYTHPDLAGNMWVNPDPNDTSNGFFGDIHGWNFFSDNNDPKDKNGHGTHVAGTIAAMTNNGIGVAGVSWNAKIMALQFLGPSGMGATSDAVRAVNYATMMRRDFGHNIILSNNSWGGGGFSQAMFNAIQAHGQAGMLFVASAGNDGRDIDASPSYPASYNLPNVIAVAATNSSDGRPSWSNWGKNTVHLGAPGASILSTYAKKNGYDTLSGTSMAAPHVSGVAALVWANTDSNNTTHLWDIKSAILAGVDPVASMQNRTITGGRLNAYNTMQLLMPVDTTPPVVTAVAFNPTPGAQSLAFTFDEDVSASLSPASLALVNQTTSATVSAADISLSYVADVATFTFPGLGGVLGSGAYIATITAQDASGNPAEGQTTYSFIWSGGTSGDDVFRVSPDSSAENLRVFENDETTPAYTAALSTLDAVFLNGGDGTDSLMIVGTSAAENVGFSASEIVLNGLTISHVNFESIRFDGMGGSDDVTVNTGASVLFTGTQRLSSLSVSGTVTVAAGSGFLHTQGLYIGGAGRLDLTDNDLIFDYSGPTPYDDLLDHVLAGYRSAPDPGATGIVSSTSQSEGGDRILVLLDNAMLDGMLNQWLGEPIDATTVVGAFTYFGDANLDRQVTGDDFALVVSNLGMTENTHWVFGDMNFDGQVTGDDATIVVSNLGKGVAAGPTALAEPTSSSSSTPFSAVPVAEEEDDESRDRASDEVLT